MKEGICFFDFDGTLTCKDTLADFAIYALGKKKFYLAVFKSLPYIAVWKTGLISSSKAKEILFGHLFKGIPFSTFQSLGESYAERIDEITRPDVIEILQNHLCSRHKAVIVSASISDWLRPWAVRHGFERVIATEAQIDDYGQLTGRFATPNCVKQEKVRRILAHYPDVKEYESWAYGDSGSDRPMLALVNHGFKV